MRTLLTVAVFAVAFAFLEAAVVVYLRHIVGFSPPPIGRDEVALVLPGIAFLKANAAVEIIDSRTLLNIEMVRETATIVMLLSVALLAGRKFLEKVAYFFLAFGIWDIFYYVFLRMIMGWPQSLADPDILFLLPVPWVGPVFVPVLISLVLVAGSFIYLSGQGRKKGTNG